MKAKKIIIMSGALTVLFAALAPQNTKAIDWDNAFSKIQTGTKALTGLAAVGTAIAGAASKDPLEQQKLNTATLSLSGFSAQGIEGLTAGAVAGLQQQTAFITSQEQAAAALRQKQLEATALMREAQQQADAGIRYIQQPLLTAQHATAALGNVAAQAVEQAKVVEQQITQAQLEVAKTAAQEIRTVQDAAALATTTSNRAMVNEASQNDIARINSEKDAALAELAQLKREAEEAKLAALKLEQEAARKKAADDQAALDAQALARAQALGATEAIMAAYTAKSENSAALAKEAQERVVNQALELAKQTEDVAQTLTFNFEKDKATNWTAIKATELTVPKKLPAKLSATTLKFLKLLQLPNDATKDDVASAAAAAKEYWTAKKVGAKATVIKQVDAVIKQINAVTTYLTKVLPE